MPLPVEPWSRIVRLDQPGRGPVEFALEPEAEARAALAERLGIDALRKLRFTGMLTPRGADWHLEATLGATAVQPCVVTLAPVTTRIDEEVVRRYLDDVPPLPPGDEIEMPQDETVEPRPAALDLGAVMAEALALALPAWPRAEGVALGSAVHAEPGVAPMTDEDARPFARLKGLLGRDDEES